MKIRISARHFAADKKLKEYIEKKLAKLGRYFDRITNVDVNLELENTGRVKDKIVEIKVKVPGKLLVYRDVANKFEPAFDKSLKGLKVQLKRYKGRKSA